MRDQATPFTSLRRMGWLLHRIPDSLLSPSPRPAPIPRATWMPSSVPSRVASRAGMKPASRTWRSGSPDRTSCFRSRGFSEVIISRASRTPRNAVPCRLMTATARRTEADLLLQEVVNFVWRDCRLHPIRVGDSDVRQRAAIRPRIAFTQVSKLSGRKSRALKRITDQPAASTS